MIPEPPAGSRRAVLAAAADFPSAEPALAFADLLRGLPVWLKVGLELFTAEGPGLVRLLGERGFSLFLDLKFHDIPNTVQGATRAAALLGVRMLTLHLSGGEAMCRAALVGRAEARDRMDGREKNAENRPFPLLMGVTVLTSEGGGEETLRSRVVRQASLARDWGLDGVVCSGREAAAVKEACGADFLCVCPGIRFGEGADDDQARVCTPEEAVRQGADFIVMGRPLIRAQAPAEAARRALADMARGFAERAL